MWVQYWCWHSIYWGELGHCADLAVHYGFGSGPVVTFSRAFGDRTLTDLFPFLVQPWRFD